MDFDKDVGKNGNARKCAKKQTRRRRVHLQFPEIKMSGISQDNERQRGVSLL